MRARLDGASAGENGVTDGRPPVRIAAQVLRDIARCAVAARPRECCGLLIGTPVDILAAWPARNLARRATRFDIAPADHFAALRAARQSGLSVVGAYHSHPGAPPRPSASDRREPGGAGFLHLLMGPVPWRSPRRYVGRPGAARRALRDWAPLSTRLWRWDQRNFVAVPFVRVG
jgi:proteasome lid subunit RPN8/RPN11